MYVFLCSNRGRLRGVMVNVRHSDIIVSEFELNTRLIYVENAWVKVLPHLFFLQLSIKLHHCYSSLSFVYT